MKREIGFYICNNCLNFVVSNFPYKVVNCQECYSDIKRTFTKTIDEKNFNKESSGFIGLAEYFTNDELITYADDRRFIKSELESKSSTSWGRGEMGDTGYYQLCRLSPKHEGDKTTIFITANDLIKEVENED